MPFIGGEYFLKGMRHGRAGLKISLQVLPKSLFEKITALGSLPIATRQAMEAKVFKTSQRSGLVRAFCWLFNIGNYRSNLYALSAFYSNAIYLAAQSYVKKTPLRSGVRDYVTNHGFNIAPTHPQVTTHLPATNQAYWLKQLSWFGRLVENFYLRHSHEFPKYPRAFPTASDEPINQPRPVPDHAPAKAQSPNTDSIIVTSAMLPHLKIIGLPLTVGTQLPLDTLKKEYHKKALQMHPDKNGGTPESEAAFIGLQKAYEAIIPKPQPSIDYWPTRDADIASARESERKLREAEEHCRIIKEKSAQFCIDLTNRYVEEIIRYRQEILKNRREILSLVANNERLAWALALIESNLELFNTLLPLCISSIQQEIEEMKTKHDRYDPKELAAFISSVDERLCEGANLSSAQFEDEWVIKLREATATATATKIPAAAAFECDNDSGSESEEDEDAPTAKTKPPLRQSLQGNLETIAELTDSSSSRSSSLRSVSLTSTASEPDDRKVPGFHSFWPETRERSASAPPTGFTNKDSKPKV